MTLALSAYREATRLFHRFVPGLLRKRVAAGKEHFERFTERLGISDQVRPDRLLVWFHGVSVGESLSLIPIIARLRNERPEIAVLITTATMTSAEILSKRLPAEVIHQFAPVDTPQAVAAFLDHWRPALAVFAESDIWPNLLLAMTARHIPHALLSARITEKSFKGWQMFRGSMRQLLGDYKLIMAQDDASNQRLMRMGVTPGPLANLKTLGAPLTVDETGLAALRAILDGRRAIVAASTHYGEDNIIAKSLEGFIRDGDLLVLVPRHPIKAGDIRLDLEALGLHVAQRSLKEPIDALTHVYLADTLGELGLFFSLADIIVMGGSFLTGIGGHNPLEAARLGKSVITGPDIANWEGVFADLLTAQGAWEVAGPTELTFLVRTLRDLPEAVAAANASALAVSRTEAGTLDRVWQALLPLLPVN